MTPTDDTAPDPSRPADAVAVLLHPSHRGRPTLDTDILGDIAGGLGAVAAAAPPHPVGITRTRLLATGAYDAWAMVWAPGTVADSHDHGGSASVVHVVEGTLVETAGSLVGDAAVARLIGPGSTTPLGATGHHTLSNPTGGVTVSIHVYSPPLGDGTHA